MQMQLSEQVKKALDYIQSIEVPERKNELETGRTFYEKFVPIAGEKEAVFDLQGLGISVSGEKIKKRIYQPSNIDDANLAFAETADSFIYQFNR